MGWTPTISYKGGVEPQHLLVLVLLVGEAGSLPDL